MRIRKFIPNLKQQKRGFNLSKLYGFGHNSINGFGSYYYLFPFNYIVRFVRWLYVKKKAKIRQE